MEGIFPSWLDLVIWGHEHECIGEVRECEENSVYFLQPGSTVATSLIEAEAVQKHCFKLRVVGQEFEVTPIPLLKVRTFLHRALVLKDTKIDPRRPKLIEEYLK